MPLSPSVRAAARAGLRRLARPRGFASSARRLDSYAFVGLGQMVRRRALAPRPAR